MKIGKITLNNFDIKRNLNKSNRNDLVFSNANNYNKFAAYPPSYYMKNLSFKGKAFKDNLAQKLKSGSEEELFIFLDFELRKRAAEKKIQHQIVDDVVQDRMMDIIIIMNSANSQKEIIEKINEIYDNFKTRKKEFITNVEDISLYKEIGNDDDNNHLSLIDVIPDDEAHKLSYLKPADKKTAEKQKKKVSVALTNAQLDETSGGLLRDRYLQDSPLKYKNIRDKYNICEQTAMLLLKRAFLKIQIANNSLPFETRKKIEDLSKSLDTDYNSALKAVLNNPYILNHSQEEIQDRIKGVAEAFKDNGLTVKQYSVCCVKHPQLLTKSAQNIEKNIRGVIEKFKDNNLSLNSYIKACIKQPSLFYQSPENIEKKVNSIVKKFENNGLTVNSYLNACIKCPSLFSSSPKTIEGNINGTVDIFSKNGLTTDKYIKAACKAASLFATPPKTVENNVKKLVKKFEKNNLTVDKYIKACIKNPPLFYQSPDTIEKNVKGFVQKFENKGLTLDKYVQSAIKAPALFSILPETIENNINNFVNEYKDFGVTTERYIRACTKNPSLFYFSINSIKQKINDFVEKFKDNGFNLNDCINCLLKQPPLFSLSPETAEKNVKDLVDKYSDKGLTLDDYIKSCITAPSLFQNCPDTIAEHIDILKFTYLNSGKSKNDEDAIKKAVSNGIELSYSSKLLLIKNLIIPQIAKHNTTPTDFTRHGHLEEKLEKYLKDNPEKTYEINVKECDTKIDCVKVLNDYLKELSQKTLGKDNVFTVNIQK